MGKMKKVVVVGSAVIDILVRSKDLRVMKSHQVTGGVALCEVYGGKVDVEEIAIETGGAGTNVAVGLSRLGLVAATISRVGDDFLKEKIFSVLSLAGVETSGIQVGKNEETGKSVVLIAPDGGRSILTDRGASQKIDPKLIDWDKIGRGDWIQISSLGGNYELLEDLLVYAKQKKIRVGWNPGRAEIEKREKILELLPKVELLIVNRMEAAMILHHSYDEILPMAKKFIDLGVKEVAITNGSKGAGLGVKGKWLWAPAYIKKKVIDETGAGDAFISGVVTGILMERDEETILKMGLANGAGEVMALGAKNGLLDEKGMNRWLKRNIKIIEESL